MPGVCTGSLVMMDACQQYVMHPWCIFFQNCMGGVNPEHAFFVSCPKSVWQRALLKEPCTHIQGTPPIAPESVGYRAVELCDGVPIKKAPTFGGMLVRTMMYSIGSVLLDLIDI